MKTYLDCIPCFIQQALTAGRLATDDKSIQKEILDKCGEMIKDIPMHRTPAETGMKVYQLISEISGVSDPYKEIKLKHIAEAKSIYKEIENIHDKAEDRLLSAIKIAIAGNIIDLGVNQDFDIVSDIKKVLDQDFAISDYSAFKNRLKHSKNILYLGDNSGESVFDKILIKELNRPVKYVVRSKPIINDVTRDEAIASGLHEVAEIIESGTQSPGIILDLASPEFLKEFEKADMIISKGQGNFEGLSDCNRQIFFLLKAKCTVIAQHIGVEKGSILLKETNPQI